MISTQFKLEAECKLLTLTRGPWDRMQTIDPKNSRTRTNDLRMSQGPLTLTLLVATVICACLTYGLVKVSTTVNSG